MPPYQPWPTEGQSYHLASTTVVLAATTLTALAARLYVLLQHKSELPVLAGIASICAAHLFMLCQSACVVVACYHGWGSPVRSLSQDNLDIAEKSFFASNLLLILVHGFSRTSNAITLWRACQSTSSTKFAVAILPVIALWTIGSVLGLIVNRAVNSTFWQPVEADCSFPLWMGVTLSGLAIDLAIAICCFMLVASLQMGSTKKLFTIFVFCAGIFVIVPSAFGLSHLYRVEAEIAADPTLLSTRFLYANQAAIAVALWSRALETARRLQQDMGYVSYGLPNFSPSAYFRSGSRSRAYYASGSKQRRTVRISRPQESAAKRSLSEDEVRLRPDASHSATIGRDDTQQSGVPSVEDANNGRIDVRREFGWSVEDASSATGRALQ